MGRLHVNAVADGRYACHKLAEWLQIMIRIGLSLADVNQRLGVDLCQ